MPKSSSQQGDTTGSVTVTAVDDEIDDDDETVVVDIDTVAGATEDGDQQVTVTITDDDAALPTVTLSVDPDAIAEAGGEATVTATLSAAAATDVTVTLAYSGTATPADDYTNSGAEIVIAAGDTTGSVTVTAVDDEIDDDDETVVVDIDTVTGATEDGDQQVTVTITDDDAALPTVTLSVDPDAIAEAGGEATVTATLSEAAGTDVTVTLAYSGTATPADDYTNSGAEIVIAAGDTTGSVTVTAVDDEVDDDDETVVVDIDAVTGANEDGDQQVTVTITDDDDAALPTVALSVDPDAIAEAGGEATVTATLSEAAGTDVTVTLAYSGTATPTDDYTNSGAEIVIAAGDTSSSVTVTAVDDEVDDDDETVVVDIDTVTGANEDGDQQVTVTITDDDDAGANQPPVLTNPGNQSMATTQDTLDVVLDASDPDAGAVITFTAMLDAAEVYLDQTLDLNLAGELFENFSGVLNEKWVLGAGDIWYYIEPSGDFYQWLGGNVVLNREFIANLPTETYDDPSRLYDAQPGQTVPATVTVDGNTLTIDPEDGFVGSFTVAATASDGSLTDTESFLVNVRPNEAPVLTNPGDQTLPTSQDTLDVTLEATDPMGDAITFSATVETIEYYLDQTTGYQLGPNGLERNWSGSEDEQWVLGDDNVTWYFITPDGNLWRWLGGNRDIMNNAELVESLSPAVHADPALLYDAQQGGAVMASVSTTGNVLTIDPDAGFEGSFAVVIDATDVGGLSDSALIRVDVTPPASVAARGVRVPTDLGQNGQFAPAADDVHASGDLELNFAPSDPAQGVVDGVSSYHDRVDAAMDHDLLEDLLQDEVMSDLLSD